MKQRDYSNPHSWQQDPNEPGAPKAKPRRTNLRPYFMLVAVAIVVIAYFSMHKHTTKAKQTAHSGPVIQHVTLPIHAKSTPTKS